MIKLQLLASNGIKLRVLIIILSLIRDKNFLLRSANCQTIALKGARLQITDVWQLISVQLSASRLRSRPISILNCKRLSKALTRKFARARCKQAHRGAQITTRLPIGGLHETRSSWHRLPSQVDNFNSSTQVWVVHWFEP